MYTIVYTKEAARDIPKLKAAHLDENAKALIDILRENPFRTAPPFEKLAGDMKGLYSRRINVKHRLVYEIFEEKKAVKIISMRMHYE